MILITEALTQTVLLFVAATTCAKRHYEEPQYKRFWAFMTVVCVLLGLAWGAATIILIGKRLEL